MKLARFPAALVLWFLASPVFALPQNDSAQPQRLRIAPEVAAGLLKHQVPPEYRDRVTGGPVPDDVFLRIVIDQQGKVIAAAPVSRDELPPDPVRPAPTEDPRVREAAVEAVNAVKQWEYRPYLLNGRPVEVETRVVVSFRPRSGVINVLIGSAAPPPKAPLPTILKISPEVLEGNLLKHEDPVYPAMARVAHIQGEVVLHARISKTGVVENLTAVTGHPILIQPAMNAVRQWKYKPFLLHDEPVEAESTVHVTFKM